jgi:serine protease inhibitor ecotin
MNHFPALISLSLGDNPLHTFNSLFDLEVKNPINMEVQYSLSSEVK